MMDISLFASDLLDKKIKQADNGLSIKWMLSAMDVINNVDTTYSNCKFDYIISQFSRKPWMILRIIRTTQFGFMDRVTLTFLSWIKHLKITSN